MDELAEIRQHLLRFTPDALVVVDDQGRIRFANETVSTLLGYQPSQLIDRSIDILIPERLRERHAGHLARFMRAPGNREMAARVMDLFALRSDGVEIPAGIRLSPFRIDGELFIAAAIRDASEQQAMMRELRLARQEADRANRAKSRFLAAVSHDLRQPMQTVQLLNSTLLKAVADPALREMLEQQGHAIEGATRLLNTLLDLSRLESGSIELSPEKVSLPKVFAGLQADFEPLAQSRGIRLQIRAAPVAIWTDPTLLHQLLVNLVGNAIKYTDEGHVQIRSPVNEAGMTIEIEDTGIGIPADKLERVFDEYYRVETQATKRVGAGLGLAIVKELARLLGFTVRMSSELGKGTTVRVFVPSRFVAAERVSEPAAAPAQPDVTPRTKPRVVLVENDDGVRAATDTFLRFEGYETVSAASAAEAEQMFERFRPGDLIITDYHLEDRTTGLDLLRRARDAVGFEVPAIIMTGDLQGVLKAVRSTAVASCRFLGKPVDAAELLAAITDLSDSRLPIPA